MTGSDSHELAELLDRMEQGADLAITVLGDAAYMLREQARVLGIPDELLERLRKSVAEDTMGCWLQISDPAAAELLRDLLAHLERGE
jgi:hypothetical protein